MASKRQLGIFWGSEFLSVAETQRNQLIFSAALPRQIAEDPHQSPQGQASTASENIHLTAAMQRLVRDQNMTKSKIHMSIPAQDVIFRSFTLPAMSSTETENAVLFEAPRYIPFKLDDLFYSYHPVPFTVGDIKKNQILFLGLRKEKLSYYCKVVEDAGLDVASVEPSLFGLLRILAVKKLITPNQAIAIVYIDDTTGSVLIANHHIPQFIRDFNVIKPDTQEGKSTVSTVDHVLNEIRVSLDFYNRQASDRPKKGVEQIYILANQQMNEIAQGLQADLSIQTTALDINTLFPYQNELHPNMASAIGASLTGAISLGFDLNLVKSRKVKAVSPSGKPTAGLENFLAQPPNYKLTTVMAIIALFIIGASFSTTRARLSVQEKKLSELETFTQEYQKKDAVIIKSLIIKTKNKSAAYKKLRFTSHLTAYLENISKSLLDGVWLNNLEIRYDLDDENQTPGQEAADATTVKKISLSIDGYSYSEQLNQQISLIEGFFKKLKTNAYFKKYAKEVTLKQVKKEVLEKFPVTYFQILIEAEEDNG